MLDTKRLLDQFLGSSQRDRDSRDGERGIQDMQLGDRARGIADSLGGFGGIGGGVLAGGLAGLLMGSKQGRRLAGTALQLGGMAVVGGLAYKAYRDWQAGRSVPSTAPSTSTTPMLPPPRDTPFNPVDATAQQSLARNLLRAMIAAAKSDGHIDAKEQARVFSEMDKLALDADDKAFVMDELRAPLDIDAVAKGAGTPEEAAEIYTASLLAVDIDNAAERAYLGLLAARLNLDERLVAHLHATVEGATQTGHAPAAKQSVRAAAP
jgi:uncharacterized membrane protein YebE (DUF533 family)